MILQEAIERKQMMKEKDWLGCWCTISAPVEIWIHPWWLTSWVGQDALCLCPNLRWLEGGREPCTHTISWNSASALQSFLSGDGLFWAGRRLETKGQARLKPPVPCAVIGNLESHEIMVSDSETQIPWATSRIFWLKVSWLTDWM